MFNWEYVIVERSIERVRKKRALSRPRVEPDFYWVLEESWTIRHPDGSVEKVEGDELSSGKVLNNLGGAGWELVSEVICERANGASRGFSSVTFPVHTRYTLKRLK